ncbi:MAG: hypothetical protein PUG66_06715 [Clostridiales bacterium]|nr:hypothetical protein [Eubacterium sp.]MDD7349518.1 hypothetical protein [Clostridiales bacterium]MDY3773935.1 hypothetical protein [Eubacterium sp.]
MWKVKYIITISMAILLLSACGNEKSQGTGEVLLYEKEETASGSAIQQEEYETTEVRQETYKEEYYDSAELEYTDTETIYIDDEDAVLDAVKVKKDQKINKGDVLAVYHVETSKTKLQKEKILVQQARANYESGLSNLQNALSQAENELMTVKNAAEKKIKQLEIKKQKEEIANYKKGEKDVIDQEKNYAQLVRRQNKTKLVAKKSGVVTSTGKEYVGDEIDASKKIVEMRSNNKWVLKVKDPDSKLRYNMDVSVRLGKNMKDYQNEVKGKVITAADITGVEETDESGDNIVYVEVSSADKKKYNFEKSNVYVYAVSFAVKDALVVDAEAINQEAVEFSNKLYVNVLENGKIHKRYIVSNYNTETEYLVEQGVSAGQTLAILR